MSFPGDDSTYEIQQLTLRRIMAAYRGDDEVETSKQTTTDDHHLRPDGAGDPVCDLLRYS
jgi:hypothetical protein